MDIGEIMWLNWNRASMLSRIQKRNELAEVEFQMRLAFQNEFANANANEKEEKKIAQSVSETLSPKMIQSIKDYLNRGKNKKNAR